MTEKLELYRCSICGNIAQIVINGAGELVCCGEPMYKLEAKSNDDNANEKHVPIMYKNDSGDTMMQIGKVPHPMDSDHYIEFVEIIPKDKKYLKLFYLYPKDSPSIKVCTNDEEIEGFAYCNIHGLWKTQD